MDPEESSTLCETPFLVSSSAERGGYKKNSAFMKSQLVLRVLLRMLTQLPDEGHKFLVLAERQDGALVWGYGCWKTEEL